MRRIVEKKKISDFIFIDDIYKYIHFFVIFFFFLLFSDRYVETLQNLDVINLKDPVTKSTFYRSTLREALPYLPRVSVCFYLFYSSLARFSSIRGTKTLFKILLNKLDISWFL